MNCSCAKEHCCFLRVCSPKASRHMLTHPPHTCATCGHSVRQGKAVAETNARGTTKPLRRPILKHMGQDACGRHLHSIHMANNSARPTVSHARWSLPYMACWNICVPSLSCSYYGRPCMVRDNAYVLVQAHWFALDINSAIRTSVILHGTYYMLVLHVLQWALERSGRPYHLLLANLYLAINEVTRATP